MLLCASCLFTACEPKTVLFIILVLAGVSSQLEARGRHHHSRCCRQQSLLHQASLKFDSSCFESSTSVLVIKLSDILKGYPGSSDHISIQSRTAGPTSRHCTDSHHVSADIIVATLRASLHTWYMGMAT